MRRPMTRPEPRVLLLVLVAAVLPPPLALIAASPAGVATAAQTAPTAAAPQTAPEIPAHPRDLRYAPLKFEVPKAEDYRVRLKSGVVAYVAEDRTLPLVTLSFTVRAGAFLDAPGKPGVSSLTGAMIRDGGTAALTAEEFDEKVDFLAADISSFGGDTESGASLGCLSSVLDPALDLFFEMLRSPRFQQDRLDIETRNLLESMKQRNDDASDILEREWDWLLRGEGHFSARRLTKDELDAVSRDDLVAFHRTWWRPENMILAIAGDVSRKEIAAALDRRFEAWKKDGVRAAPVPWPPAPPAQASRPGLYHVEKDIPQGKVAIGHTGTRWTRWDEPDNFALMVMNEILGGGGFTSRIVKKVRSDEGLAYHASSRFEIGSFWPGEFRISYQSKNPTVALAAKLSLAEVRRLRDEPVAEEELAVAKSSFIDAFPRRFESPRQVASTFAMDEYLGRPHGHWVAWRDSIRKVTAQDVQRVARTYLQPEKLVFLVVGKWSEVEPGDPDGRASMREFIEGRVTHLPLRDPLTLKPAAGTAD